MAGLAFGVWRAGRHVAVDVSGAGGSPGDRRGRRDGRGGRGRLVVAGRAAGSAACRPRSSSPRAGRATPSPVDLAERPDRRGALPSRPTPASPTAAPAWAGSSASPNRSTPASVPPWATRWSCGCGPPTRRLDRPDLRPLERAELERVDPDLRHEHPHDSRRARRFILPERPAAGPGRRHTDIQTFYLAQSGAEPGLPRRRRPRGVVLQSRDLFLTSDGDIVSARPRWAPGPSTRWCRTSTRPTEPAARPPPPAGGPCRPRRSLDPAGALHPAPAPLPAGGQALARSVTGTPASVDHLRQGRGHRAWIVAAHVRYTTDIPPLAPGADTVDELPLREPHGLLRADLHRHRRSCSGPSASRPARRWATCPGSYDPITDLYDVQANDAHAWVQVWFPGYGWQSFDPTAVVPLANPSPGSVLAARSVDRAGPPALAPHRPRPRVLCIGDRPGPRGGAGAVRPPGPTRWPPTSSPPGGDAGLVRRRRTRP